MSLLPTTDRFTAIARALLGGLVALVFVVSVEAASIEIRNESDLEFGAVIASTTGGSVTVTPAGQRVISGVYNWGAGTFGAARFTVQVDESGNPHFTITLPSSLTLTNGSVDSLLVTDFQSLPTGTGMAQPPQRTATVDVGATLQVAPQQPGGSYSGTFPVIVNLGN